LDKTQIGGLTREQIVQEGLIKWYLKDDRTPPMELQGYVSGSSASEEEDESPYNDMAHISQVRSRGADRYHAVDGHIYTDGAGICHGVMMTRTSMRVIC